jgi:hypothetical protein
VTSGSFSPNGRVAASKYSANWNSYGLWIPPFPCASATDPNLSVPSAFFNTLVALPNSISQNDGQEQGLAHFRDFLGRSDVNNTATPANGFLRPDATLAMIVLTTGRDLSYGYEYINYMGYPEFHVDESGPSTFATQMGNIKSTLLTKFYTVAALSGNMYNCRASAGAVWNGYTYKNVSDIMHGKSYDICQYEASTALNAIANDLTQQSAVFRKRFLSVPSNPSLDTVTVTKISNGNETVLANDPVNGWTYYGQVSSASPVFSIDAFFLSGDPTAHPYTAKPISGYIIELHGTAKLIGGDTARVEYMNSGAVIAQ